MARPIRFSYALTTPGQARMYSTRELLELPAPQWLVEGIIPDGALVALYGQPASFKTFCALDLSLSIACGGHWQGHAINGPNYVLYISAEGGTGIGKRVKAWMQSRRVEAKDIHAAWILEPITVHDTSDGVDKILERIQTEVERTPTLVVIDTLARCFEGDENGQDDMGRFIKGVDRLRHEWGAAALVIHHTRLDGDRERGNTAFRGGADTMMSVERSRKRNSPTATSTSSEVIGFVTLTCNKQKDAEEFPPMRLKMVTVPGTDSCCVDINAPHGRLSKDVLDENGLTPGCAAILQRITIGPMNRAELLTETKLLKGTLSRYLKLLAEKGLAIEENDGSWVAVSDDD